LTIDYKYSILNIVDHMTDGNR